LNKRKKGKETTTSNFKALCELELQRKKREKKMNERKKGL